MEGKFTTDDKPKRENRTQLMADNAKPNKIAIKTNLNEPIN